MLENNAILFFINYYLHASQNKKNFKIFFFWYSVLFYYSQQDNYRSALPDSLTYDLKKGATVRLT